MQDTTFSFGLDAGMRPVTGRAALSPEGTLTATEDGTPTLRVSVADVQEASVLSGVGCGLVFLKMKTPEGAPADERVLCRFDMSQLKPAGEFCKIINFRVQTGQAAASEDIELPACPKCGRPYPEGSRVCLFCYSKTGVLGRAFSMMKKYRATLAGAGVMTVLSNIAFLMPPLIVRYLIDTFFEPRTGTLRQILLVVAFALALRVAGETVYIFAARAINRVFNLFSNDLRNHCYEKIQKLSMNALSRRTPGELIRRVMEDTVTIKDFLCDNGRWCVEQSGMFLTALVILLATDPLLTAIVFVPVPIVAFALSRFWSMIHIRYDRQWRRSSRCQSILHDIIKGIRTVKSFGAEAREIDKFSRVTKDYAQICQENETMWATVFPAMLFFTGIGEFLILYLGGRRILAGRLTIGVLVQFTSYITFVYNPLRWLVSFPRMLGEALTSLVKMFEILDEEPAIADTPESRPAPPSPRVAYERVGFGYKSYEPVLKEVSFTIEPGEMVGIVGRSGAGKSTLINLMLRLYDPNTGRITLGADRLDLRSVSPSDLHEKAGVVFQDTFLFAGTIYDNILYAKPDATPAEVIAACKAANAHDFIVKTSDGYDTLIGENGYSISGGERQRLAIARAIIKNPNLLILDEATSSLDLETESVIQDSLNRLVKQRTTIAIAHRLSTLRAADRLIVLDKGRIAEVGSHMELMRSKGIYYRLVMAQRQTSKTAA